MPSQCVDKLRVYHRLCLSHEYSNWKITIAVRSNVSFELLLLCVYYLKKRINLTILVFHEEKYAIFSSRVHLRMRAYQRTYFVEDEMILISVEANKKNASASADERRETTDRQLFEKNKRGGALSISHLRSYCSPPPRRLPSSFQTIKVKDESTLDTLDMTSHSSFRRRSRLIITPIKTLVGTGRSVCP